MRKAEVITLVFVAFSFDHVNIKIGSAQPLAWCPHHQQTETNLENLDGNNNTVFKLVFRWSLVRTPTTAVGLGITFVGGDESDISGNY